MYMSEESSDEENECMRLHHLQWTSDGKGVSAPVQLCPCISLIELQELKGLLDDRIKEKNVCAGRFTAKPRVEGSPSVLPMPTNPVQWAVTRYG